MNMKRIAAGYAVVLGVGVVGFWIAALAGGEVPEMETAPVSLGFHLFAEFLLGGVLVAAGIGVLLFFQTVSGKYPYRAVREGL